MEKGKCYVLLRGTVKGSVEQISERFLTVYNGDRLEASGGGADKGLFNQSNRFESPRILTICTVLLYCCNTRSLIHTNCQPCGSGLFFLFSWIRIRTRDTSMLWIRISWPIIRIQIQPRKIAWKIIVGIAGISLRDVKFWLFNYTVLNVKIIIIFIFRDPYK